MERRTRRAIEAAGRRTTNWMSKRRSKTRTGQCGLVSGRQRRRRDKDSWLLTDFKTMKRDDPADPAGQSVPAPLTQNSLEADPCDPLALNFWARSATRWADPAHSHPAGGAWKNPRVCYYFDRCEPAGVCAKRSISFLPRRHARDVQQIHWVALCPGPRPVPLHRAPKF